MDHSVRAILVYPMNALINSQLDALKAFQHNLPDSPVRFARYTGQENNEDRDRILADPPHILLTNYVMAALPSGPSRGTSPPGHRHPGSPDSGHG